MSGGFGAVWRPLNRERKKTLSLFPENPVRTYLESERYYYHGVKIKTPPQRYHGFQQLGEFQK